MYIFSKCCSFNNYKKKVLTQFVRKKNQLMVWIGHPFECAKSAHSSLIVGKTNYVAPLLYQLIKTVSLHRFYTINPQITHTNNIIKCTECSQYERFYKSFRFFIIFHSILHKQNAMNRNKQFFRILFCQKQTFVLFLSRLYRFHDTKLFKCKMAIEEEK